QRAVAIFEHVSEMRVRILQLKKLAFGSAVGPAVGGEFHPGDALGVEVDHKEVAAPVRVEGATAVERATGDGDMAEVVDHRHHLERARQASDGMDLIFPGIKAPTEPVDDGVAARATVEKIYRADDFALRSKVNFRRVVRTRERVPADVRAIGFARPDARRETGMDERAILLFHFVALPAMTPIESAIGMEEGPVNVRCVARVFEAADDHLALIGHTVAVGVGEFPDAGRRRDIERAVEPDAALRES